MALAAANPNGNVRITLDLNSSIEDKHVILVEDIIDSGHTLASVLELLGNSSTRPVCAFALCWIKRSAAKWKSR